MKDSTDVPRNGSQLYDELHEWFGFGDWDEGTSAKPWYEARMAEIGKLNRLIASRRASIRQLHITGLYCREKGITPRSPAGLFLHIGDAMKAHALAEERAKRAEVEAEINAAIQWEREHHPDDSTWFDRLVRAQGDERKEVLHRWKLGRQRYRKN